MAQSGYTPIQIYYSATASSVPVNTNLAAGELAINTNDGKLFYKDSSGVVQVIASKAAAAGVTSFTAGTTGLTPSTATSGAVTLAGTLGISNGGTGITSFGTGVQTALGVNVGTAGSFLVNGGVLGTPSSGTVTNLTGTASININGTVGATTPSTGVFTTLTDSGLTAGRVNYNGTGGLLVDSANLTFNGTTLTAAGFAGPISGVVTSSSITDSGLTSGRVTYAGTGGLLQDAAALTFDGTILSATRFAGALNGTVGATTASTGAFTTISATGVITSTLATGTAPFTVASTTNVANLNASSLSGATFASPGAIGSTTAGTGAFTTLAASSTVSGTGFTTYFASPPALGTTAPAEVKVTVGWAANTALTDAATIAWDTTNQVATFTFVSTNRTFGAPTNLKNGAFYALAVIQNGGSNTLTWNAVFKWAAGTAPTLSTAAGAKDYFTFRSDGTNLYQQGISQAVA